MLLNTLMGVDKGDTSVYIRYVYTYFISQS